MPWFLTPHGPHFVVEPGTIDEYERRDYTVMTPQQVTDYYAGVAIPEPSFATEAEVPGIVADAIAAGTGPVAEELRAALGAADPVLSDFVYDPATGNLLSYKEDGIPIVLTYNADGTVATSKRGTAATKTFTYSGGNLAGVA